MQEIVGILEDYIFFICCLLIILYYIVRTLYSFYEYRQKYFGFILFKFGHNSSFMIFWGIWILLFYVLSEIINAQLKGISFIRKENILLFIMVIFIASFLIYFGSKKNRICENGIASFSGCWKLKEIEKYEWKYGITNTVKYLCIKVPKNIFLLGKKQAYLKISKKEYLQYKKSIEEYFTDIYQTSA